MLNKWFDSYPLPDQKELKAKFISAFQDAFYELFLFSLFKNLDFKVQIEKEVTNKKRPDFLCSKDDVHFWAEARVVKDRSEKEVAKEKKRQEFLNQLNRIECPLYDFWIEKLEFLSENQPKVSGIKSLLNKQLETLDWDKTQGADYDNSPIFRYEDNDVTLGIRLQAVKLEQNQIGPKRNIKSEEAIGFSGWADHSIKRALKKKATKYGNLDAPYIICINNLTYKLPTLEDAFRAIWGSQYLIKNSSEDDGFFSVKKARNTRVSAVIITCINENFVMNAQHWLFLNPFAKHPFPVEALQLSYFQIHSCKSKEITGKSIGDIMNGQ